MPEVLILTGPPKVTLRAARPHAYDGAIAAARTCYSPRVVTPAEDDSQTPDAVVTWMQNVRSTLVAFARAWVSAQAHRAGP